MPMVSLMVRKESCTALYPSSRSVSILQVSPSPYGCSMRAGIVYGVRYRTWLADEGYVSISLSISTICMLFCCSQKVNNTLLNANRYGHLATKAAEEENDLLNVFLFCGFCNRKSIAFTLVALALLVGVLGANASYAAGTRAGTSFTFRTLDDQADPTFNQLLGINDRGVIAGYFGSGLAGHPNKGYTLSPPYGQGNYTNENFPNSVQTQVTAINNIGTTAGFWIDANGNNFGFIKSFGRFTSYTNPNTDGGTVNQLLGINDEGIAVGFYTDANGINHAYKLNSHTGQFTAIVPPGGSNATAAGINDEGDVVGFLTLTNGTIAGFLLKGTTFTEFDFPNSTNTTALGVNVLDQIVGVYVDSAGKMHGFLLSTLLRQPHFQSIDDPNGVGTTTINGLNDKDDLVGFYVDSAGNTDGFLANRSRI